MSNSKYYYIGIEKIKKKTGYLHIGTTTYTLPFRFQVDLFYHGPHLSYL